MADIGAGWKNNIPQYTGSKPLQLLARCEWTGTPPKWSTPLDLPANKVFLVPTNRPPCFSQRNCMAELQRMQIYHMRVDSVSDIRYNFVITNNGVVYEARGWKESPSLPMMYEPVRKKSLYIAFTGDFRDPKVPVPATVLESMERLFKLGVDYKYLSPDFETFDL